MLMQKGLLPLLLPESCTDTHYKAAECTVVAETNYRLEKKLKLI